ncbi:cupin domain-containing protein [Macrococcoides caseolyticum]|uniref:cupin domain-containing protein n=1 Tax=Macrococcoides caseolyticum TaxID=69966 RepID=UPI001F241391|nr:cupin domain-containing protein [Macrococcus caseolyticus]MCE4955920.1 cupin domain-containing protein [Macrococcus caseolyticus]
MKYKILHSPVSNNTPNHMILPVIIYQDINADFKTLFTQHHWHGIWTGSVFDYHHFHPDTHEVLGVLSGEATLMIGGDLGSKITVKKGDALLLSAGYGHRLIEARSDFKVVGAYPEDQSFQTLTNYESIDAINRVINAVKLPEFDPIEGNTGAMFKEWHNIYHCGTYIK